MIITRVARTSNGQTRCCFENFHIVPVSKKKETNTSGKEQRNRGSLWNVLAMPLTAEMKKRRQEGKRRKRRKFNFSHYNTDSFICRWNNDGAERFWHDWRSWLKVSKRTGCSCCSLYRLQKTFVKFIRLMERTNTGRGGGGGFSVAAFEVRFNSLGSKTVEMNLRDTGNIFPREIQREPARTFSQISRSHTERDSFVLRRLLNVICAWEIKQWNAKAFWYDKRVVIISFLSLNVVTRIIRVSV